MRVISRNVKIVSTGAVSGLALTFMIFAVRFSNMQA